MSGWSNPGGTWVSRGLTQGDLGQYLLSGFLVAILFIRLDGPNPQPGGQVHRGTRFHETPGCPILFDKFGKVLDASRSICGCWET